MPHVRRSAERRYVQRQQREQWQTFFDAADPAGLGFDSLRVLDESRLPPGNEPAAPSPGDGETITYVLEGALRYDDSLGRSGVIRAGEFQRASSSGVTCGMRNASRSEWVHFFSLGFSAAEGTEDPGLQLKRFGTGRRRGGLCPVASRDGHAGSLSTAQNLQLYSALLDPGQHVVHDLGSGRAAWLHVVRGEAMLGITRLCTGDGCGFAGEHAVSVTAAGQTELLLVSLLGPE